MKCFRTRKVIDLHFDETIPVKDLIKEVADTFLFETEGSHLISVNRKRVLNKNKSFEEQGISGGDTLILIEGKGVESDYQA